MLPAATTHMTTPSAFVVSYLTTQNSLSAGCRASLAMKHGANWQCSSPNVGQDKTSTPLGMPSLARH